MNNAARQFFNDAPELLRRFAQTEEDEFSSILTQQDLEMFQNANTQRVRKYPACPHSFTFHEASCQRKQVLPKHPNQ